MLYVKPLKGSVDSKVHTDLDQITIGSGSFTQCVEVT